MAVRSAECARQGRVLRALRGTWQLRAHQWQQETPTTTPAAAPAAANQVVVRACPARERALSSACACRGLLPALALQPACCVLGTLRTCLLRQELQVCLPHQGRSLMEPRALSLPLLLLLLAAQPALRHARSPAWRWVVAGAVATRWARCPPRRTRPAGLHGLPARVTWGQHTAPEPSLSCYNHIGCGRLRRATEPATATAREPSNRT